MMHGKLPWRIETGGKRKMSAILDADDRLVAGSLICEQNPESIANHKFIVQCVNREWVPELKTL